jgi:hypothetical protein
MPMITSLVLTMSRDSNRVVAAQVDYTLNYTGAEAMANLAFEESALLLRRVGTRDVDSLQTLPVAQGGTRLIITTAPGDASDELVAVLYKITTHPNADGVPPTPNGGQVKRTYKHELTGDELSKLLEPGREHPYLLVTVLPTDVKSDIQIAEVDIDVGDPGEPPPA